MLTQGCRCRSRLLTVDSLRSARAIGLRAGARAMRRSEAYSVSTLAIGSLARVGCLLALLCVSDRT